jgi:hypothetical protein
MAIFLPVMLLDQYRPNNYYDLRVEEGLDDLSRESVLLVLVLDVSLTPEK